MHRADVVELHYITPISNLSSIKVKGILSHRRAASLPHHSVAMQEIQDRRKHKAVPGARPLHDYVNLYFSARNPMLYKKLGEHLSICILGVSARVLDLPGTVIADGNAASGYIRFHPSPQGRAELDHTSVFAENWNDVDQFAKWEKTRRRCAEILVPDVVPPSLILHVYASCAEAVATCQAQKIGLEAKIDAHLFFRT